MITQINLIIITQIKINYNIIMNSETEFFKKKYNYKNQKRVNYFMFARLRYILSVKHVNVLIKNIKLRNRAN